VARVHFEPRAASFGLPSLRASARIGDCVIQNNGNKK
jgi:hypothetical protein